MYIHTVTNFIDKLKAHCRLNFDKNTTSKITTKTNNTLVTVMRNLRWLKGHFAKIQNLVYGKEVMLHPFSVPGFTICEVQILI